MRTNILIVGGSGFVGTNILKRIDHSKYSVRATRNKSKKYFKNNKIKYFRGNLKNLKFCEKITNSIDIVVMCAAVSSGAMIIQNNPMFHVNDNIVMNLNILKASAKNKVKKFIFLSSNTVYPVGNKSMIEKDMNYDLFSKYFNVGWMKIFSEKLCEMYKDKMIINIIRPANLYGPHDKFDPIRSKVVPALIRKFHISKKNKKVEIWGSGNAKRELMHVDDLSDAIHFFMKKLYSKDKKFIKLISEKPYINIGTGKDMKIRDYANIVKELINKDAKIFYNRKYPDGTPRKLLDISKMRTFGWKPKIRLKDGIINTYKWALKNKVI